MRPFNLEEYLKHPSRKLVTKDGHDARIVCTDRLGDYPIVALIHSREDEESLLFYLPTGKQDTVGDEETDLLFADNLLPDFKPYDRVLTRISKALPWRANLFSNFKKQGNNTIAVCLKGDYLLSDIIPFDENKVGKIE